MTTTTSLTGPDARPLSGKLPKQMLVFLHGLGADGDDLFGLTPYFQEALPDAYCVSLHAPFACDMAPYGKQWFSLQDRTEAVLVQEIQKAADILNPYLDEQLQQFELKEHQLALIGFSQGAMLALHVALRRSSSMMGVVAYSGALVAPHLLKTQLASKPPVCLVHGQADMVVPFIAFEEALAALKKYQVEVHGYSSEALGHGIDPAGVKIGIRFLEQAVR